VETKTAVWGLATNADSSGTMAWNITMDGLEKLHIIQRLDTAVVNNQIDQDIASYSDSCRGDVFLSTQVV